MVRSAEATERQLKDLTNDSSVHGIGKDKKMHHSERNPQPMKTSTPLIQTRCLIAEIVEQDMVWENAQRTARHVTIVRDNIISKSMCRSQKKVHGLMPAEVEYDCESTLFVRAVTTVVQIQNDECYVTLPVQGHLT